MYIYTNLHLNCAKIIHGFYLCVYVFFQNTIGYETPPVVHSTLFISSELNLKVLCYVVHLLLYFFYRTKEKSNLYCSTMNNLDNNICNCVMRKLLCS